MRERSEKSARVILLILGTVVIGSSGCWGTAPEIRLDVSVEPDSLSLQVGQQAEVSARISTTNVDRDEVQVSFRARDSDIATVTRTGDRSATVTGQTAGQTVISVAASVGPNPKAIFDSVHVSVEDR